MEATGVGIDLTDDELMQPKETSEKFEELVQRFADISGIGELDSGLVLQDSVELDGMAYHTRRLLEGYYSKLELGRPSDLFDLPEGVVDNILSRLTVKDAAATSFTCKAWEQCWTYSPSLVFANHWCHYLSLDPIMMVKEREKYVRWVTDVIRKYKRSKIERFHILFDLDSSYRKYIDDWMEFSLCHEVKDLILELFRPFDPYFRINYSFPKGIDGDSLRVLVLENVDLDEEDFQNISHFKALRELSVTGASRLKHIRMVDSSVHVKSLVVRNCLNLEHIEICDVQLEDFQFEGRPIRLDLNRVPSLLKVSLCENDMEFLKLGFKQLGCCLSQLRTLTLDNSLSFLEVENFFPIPQLPKLEHLELRISADDANVLLQLTSFLNACPRLQKLSLKVDFLETDITLFKAESLPHNNLKIVEVVGFCDCKAATDIVTYIIENAAVLQKLVINPVLPWSEMRNGRKSDEAVQKEERGRHHAICLGENMPESLDFSCL